MLLPIAPTPSTAIFFVMVKEFSMFGLGDSSFRRAPKEVPLGGKPV
jgi:hypothetical protein